VEIDRLGSLIASQLARSRLRVYSPNEYGWVLAGRCSSPRSFTIGAKPQRREVRYAVAKTGAFSYERLVPEGYVPRKWDRKLSLHMTVRCRKCDVCRKYRQWVWSMRAEQEARLSHRQWMVTLTFKPEEHYLMGCEIERDLNKNRGSVTALDHESGEIVDQPYVSLDSLSLREQFGLRQKYAGAYVTRWFKRLRKAGYGFRYLCVAEAHQSGLPHFHVVVHEIGSPIRHKVFKETWPHGFTKVKLCDGSPRAVEYVTKYVAKNGAARVRASIRYGVNGEETLVDEIERNVSILVEKQKIDRERSRYRCTSEASTEDGGPKDVRPGEFEGVTLIGPRAAPLSSILTAQEDGIAKLFWAWLSDGSGHGEAGGVGLSKTGPPAPSTGGADVAVCAPGE